MRNVTLAIAAVLACAASPALAQDAQKTPTIAPPHAAQAAPGLPNPPKAEIAPGAAKAPTGAENILPRPSRFAFNRVDGGFLRLDSQSGQVAFCSAHDIGWACQVVPEDRAALEKEIARLQDEVASLKSEVAALHEPPPPPRPPADLTPPSSDQSQSEDATKLREDLARARAAFESAWRRLVEIIVQLQKDMMRKG